MVPTLKHHAFYVGVHVLNNLVRAHAKALLFDKGIIKVLFKVVCNLMGFWRHVELDCLVNQHPPALSKVSYTIPPLSLQSLPST